ncbi:hypothetical protein PR048_017990 [Dryococelus australis]|uniref:Uncharacterized protein n=1 Tax=Dryococelus australis TaxID=614101 RepID=A0ABQ9HB42_9NEOP|nr:hypothetical protein PR048_017990 [Dryococelus australis]
MQQCTPFVISTLFISGTGERKCDIANCFNILASTLSTIISNCMWIENNSVFVRTHRICSKSCKNEDLGKNLFEWLIEARTSNINVSVSIL